MPQPPPASPLSTPPRAAPALRCREIGGAEVDAVAQLLARGFPRRGLDYWRRGLRVMAERDSPPGRPRFGHVLEVDGRLVGAILTIHAPSPRPGEALCNLSSWFVEPAYQSYAPLMIKRATRQPDVTYFNISPAPNTLRTVEAQGFTRYSADRVLAVPALARGSGPCRIRRVGPMDADAAALGVAERDLAALRSAARLGCASLVADGPGGAVALSFLRTAVKRVVPAALLVHAPSLEGFAAVAGPVGRFFARRGVPLVLVDDDRPIPGVFGLRRAGAMPKYSRGPSVPAPWQLASCEWTVFGP